MKNRILSNFFEPTALASIALAGWFLIPTALCASVSICNHRAYEVSAAVGYSYDDAQDCMSGCIVVRMNRAVSEGWWNLTPGSCAVVSGRDGTRFDGSKIYVRIRKTDGQTDLANPTYYLCTNPSARYLFEKTDARAAGNAMGVVECGSEGRCSHPSLGECAGLFMSYGQSGASRDVFEEFTISSSDWTLDLD